MSSNPKSTTSTASQSPEFVDEATKNPARTDRQAPAHKPNEEFRGGVVEALELGKSSMDAAVCLSCCALDIYRSAYCFAPQLSGYFELGSRLLAACAELQSNYFHLLKPHAEALSSPEWMTRSCEPDEVLERSMDIALGALSAQMSFLKDVTEAGVSFDVMRGGFDDLQQPA